jgi:hypothetical protein
MRRKPGSMAIDWVILQSWNSIQSRCLQDQTGIERGNFDSYVTLHNGHGPPLHFFHHNPKVFPEDANAEEKKAANGDW